MKPLIALNSKREAHRILFDHSDLLSDRVHEKATQKESSDNTELIEELVLIPEESRQLWLDVLKHEVVERSNSMKFIREVFADTTNPASADSIE